jgi:hypothetical protein
MKGSNARKSARALLKLYINYGEDENPEYNSKTFKEEFSRANWGYLGDVPDDIIYKFLVYYHDNGELYAVNNSCLGGQIIIILSYWAIVDCNDLLVQFLLKQILDSSYNFYKCLPICAVGFQESQFGVTTIEMLLKYLIGCDCLDEKTKQKYEYYRTLLH